jgi:hypothetical protein
LLRHGLRELFPCPCIAKASGTPAQYPSGGVGCPVEAGYRRNVLSGQSVPVMTLCDRYHIHVQKHNTCYTILSSYYGSVLIYYHIAAGSAVPTCAQGARCAARAVHRARVSPIPRGARPREARPGPQHRTKSVCSRWHRIEGETNDDMRHCIAPQSTCMSTIFDCECGRFVRKKSREIKVISRPAAAIDAPPGVSRYIIDLSLGYRDLNTLPGT